MSASIQKQERVTISGNDGNKYEFNSKENKVYIIQTNKFYGNLFTGLAFAFLLAIAYDWIKDVMRNLSGIRDLYRGETESGFTKYIGFTKGNITRFAVVFGLGIALYLVYPKVSSRKQIDIKDVPQDVLSKYSNKNTKLV